MEITGINTIDVNLEILTIKTSIGSRSIYLRQGTSDTMLVGQIFLDNAFDLDKLARLNELNDWLQKCRQADKRPLIIDAGANIGLSAIAFAAQVPDALIVAIEPEAENVALLIENTKGLSVLPVPAALMGVAGKVIIEDSGDGAWGYRTKMVESGSLSAIPVVTIDEIIAAHDKSSIPFIVKIDIEGAESHVFDCDASWVDQVPLIIVELHDWMMPGARTAQPVLKRLLQSDRDFVIIGENIFSLLVKLPELPE